jgi:ferredoxin-NADP reductase
MERKMYAARLINRQLLSERAQTYHFTFAMEDEPAFDFLPGQFVSLVEPDARGKQQTRAYSIASAPRGNQFDLCVNRVEGGFFSNRLADMPVGEAVPMHGPHGLFTLRQPLTHCVLIATGTGIAPMRGFVEWLFPDAAPSRMPPHKTITLIYGTRHESEIYYRDLFEKTAAVHSNFRYLPTLSRASDEWQGFRGYVQHHVFNLLAGDADRALASEFARPLAPAPAGATLATAPPQRAGNVSVHPESDTADNPRMPNSDGFPIHAYICGLNEMVSANREQLKQLGWDRKQIVFERYD